MLDTNGRHHEPSTSGGDDVEAGWGKVADAFRANFEGDPGEIGAACSVYVDGRPVVNLWGGLADREANRPWDEDTIVQVASTTKGATAICAHLLAQRGELDLDAPVVEYWPEFGAHGKDKIPVRWLLSHQAGLPVVDGPLTFEQACAWDPVIRALEAQKPLWEPGTEHAYHAVTYGFLVGEVVRRITGRSLGAFFAEEVAGPLGLSAWIGLPEAEEKRVARFEDAAPFTLEELLAGMIATTGLDADTVTAWVRSMWSPDALQIRAGVLGGAMDPATGYFRTRAWRAAEFPAREHARGRAFTGTHVRRHGQRGGRSATARPVDGRDDDGGPDRQDADARAAARAGHPGRPFLLHVAGVLAVLRTDADDGTGVVRPPGLRRFDRLRGPRRARRLRLCHESLELPARRHAGGEPDQGRPLLSRMMGNTA
nr:hypothetical protein GCM10020241_04550 [Streptoalloteichus tenebrarius]